jgi:hypothetical protein
MQVALIGNKLDQQALDYAHHMLQYLLMRTMHVQGHDSTAQLLQSWPEGHHK